MKKSKCKINNFKYPASDKISGRISTICRSMACTLLDRKACSKEEEELWMTFFPEKQCAYCGKKATHLDHLHPLITGRKPTGYGTEPSNLVPCCDKCNQPKGNLDWKTFMKKLIQDCQTEEETKAIEKRMNKIEAFQEAMPPKKVTLSDEMIKKWIDILDAFDEALKEAEADLLTMHKELYKK